MPSYVDNDRLAKVTLPRINALLALRDEGTWPGAMKATKRKKASLSAAIKDLEEIFDCPILTEDSVHGTNVALTRHGQDLADHLQVVKHRLDKAYIEAQRRPISVVGLPHHDQLILPLVQRLGEGAIAETFLDEHQRASFETDAVIPLEHRVYDVIIGLPPERLDDPKEQLRRESELKSVPIYQARLEAMLPRTYEEDSIDLATLATSYKLNVPSDEFRSRALLEDAIRKLEIDVPPPARRIRLEGHLTKNLVRYGWYDIGVPVLPSDIAMAWKYSGDFGGLRSKLYTWVPVLLHGQPLTHSVNVTVRRYVADPVEEVFQQLLGIAEELRGQLEGTAPGV